jgi:HEAT repeat protein
MLDELLTEPDWNRCKAQAAEGLAAGTLTPARLLEACRAAGPEHRRRALMLLASLPAETLAGIDAPVELLEDICWPVREAVAVLLGRLGAASEALARLAIRDPSPHVREAAAGAAGPSLLAVTISALTAPRWKVRRKAVEALAHAPQAAEAIALLEQALADPDERVRASAAASLGRLGDAAGVAVPALRGRLGERSDRVRRAVEQALALLGEKA